MAVIETAAIVLTIGTDIDRTLKKQNSLMKVE
jgi:hypothetical protein